MNTEGVQHSEKIIKRLRNFDKTTKLKKAVLYFIATRCSPDDIEH